MPWLTVDKFSKREIVHEEKPNREELTINGYHCGSWDLYHSHWIKLPKGSIEKLIGRKLTFRDNPVEIKNKINQ